MPEGVLVNRFTLDDPDWDVLELALPKESNGLRLESNFEEPDEHRSKRDG